MQNAKNSNSSLEMPGIEPGAFHMQSERATTALHPLLIIQISYYLKNIFFQQMAVEFFKNFSWFRLKLLSETPEVGGQGGHVPPQVLGYQLTLFGPKGADYARYITTCPPHLFG